MDSGKPENSEGAKPENSGGAKPENSGGAKPKTFLTRMLSQGKGKQYFDSGDYELAKQTGESKVVPVNPSSDGNNGKGVIPTVDKIPAKKTPAWGEKK